jgi:beta-lactamase superfamily II metal-dependent hydrolase
VSRIKSFAIGNGDMFYITHNSKQLTIIDCNLPDDRRGALLAELKTHQNASEITRFISTHPDQDHICGLADLDDHLGLRNFYCVANGATKDSETDDFKRYKILRDGGKAFYVVKGCKRRWMNETTPEHSSAGLQVLWPATSDPDFQSALRDAANGMTPNNISCIVAYKLDGGARFMWMGDLETDFMEKILDKVAIPEVDVLFAPHHGRDSGKVPYEWLEKMNPSLVVIGEAPSEYLDYYDGWNTITQNQCGDILFDLSKGWIDVYVNDSTYARDFFEDRSLDVLDGLYYTGSLAV